ncbi:hypothetical protein chiPu_0031630 [Chiloscyllium punctatum]|uniref:Uncharacterized protein n=1 Tax=Chiloscyllium punctatum TaxID=137246 RepID=A0A401TYA3_CHIPU|nr:hypothetical protein [Chiloscyllium punctatum]
MAKRLVGGRDVRGRVLRRHRKLRRQGCGALRMVMRLLGRNEHIAVGLEAKARQMHANEQTIILNLLMH